MSRPVDIFYRPVKTFRLPDKCSAKNVLDRTITPISMGITINRCAGKYVLQLYPACPRCQGPFTAVRLLLKCNTFSPQRVQRRAALRTYGPLQITTDITVFISRDFFDLCLENKARPS
ncbi:hypothetical protein DPMN_152534 [Dreissena polymorpha]|uniref:Uncharacterized protein n=1 Tax=Dreissena polymorpha TaxID=45954 RepID=A0A9D4FM04_DREPO|nr:hypothetical protein DPMN_152534 [Dreissena polymorpha]